MGEDADLRRTVSGSETQSRIEEAEWVVVKSLLDAQDACTNTIEEFLLYTTTDRTEGLPTEELRERLDELIAKQESAVTEMELAKRALTDLDTE